jgi:hypothetical protein
MAAATPQPVRSVGAAARPVEVLDRKLGAQESPPRPKKAPELERRAVAEPLCDRGHQPMTDPCTALAFEIDGE